jgi:hypothetical protein
MIIARHELTAAHVQAASSREGIQKFLGQLGYDISEPVEQTPAGLGVAERAHHAVRQIWRLAAQRLNPGLPPALEVYWFELRTLTADLRKALAAAFRNKPVNVLLLLTTRDFDPLDFVLVERDAAASAGPGGQVAVSARFFSVARRHPSGVHLRVLGRMDNSAADPYAQYDRLRDAFTLAEWSEDEFNNRNLFSDYFLKKRLTDPRLFPEWDTDVRSAHRELARLLEAAGDVRTLTADALRTQFIGPVLEALGFRLAAPAGEAQADALLVPRGAAADAAPCAALLAYPWDRPLDRKHDADRDRPDDVPGIRVIRALEQHQVPWAVLTNGKDWRLYCAAAHSRASNYYEVDLPESLAAADLKAFRYFYLFFRADAFAPGADGAASFLDRLRQGSAAFAKELGDRLRGSIFDEVFPYLAEGFVQDRKRRTGTATRAGDPFLAAVYDATLTLLYRLLFLLFAEALDLLPVHEPAYREVSLRRLIEEVAGEAGGDADAVEERLRRRYSASDADLYARLAKLFRVIDEGSKEHNVPAYNGGLFSTRPPQDDPGRDAAATRFLTEHRVPDVYLARALDLLARGEDPKTGELVFIDYKSLGVRQLGSIYEGLLMYHVVVPQDDWEREYLRPGLRVALVPSNKERKSTGSYFTPQHIVKYIVANTVGPLLEEKFAAARPRLRDAQRRHAEAVKFQQQKADKLRRPPPPAETIARDVLRDYEGAVWDLFDLKVLDPAMGSGHFLVETVDFVTDRVLDLLAGFPWNPVQVLLDLRIRRQIGEALDGQGVTVNEDRLTDVNLVKRLVMKRCVYGVDLNPMAVELAKVSLWLDSFTVGAPLSFLDHHLKCGNSLIGATIEDLKKTAQGWLYGIPMEPLERATRNMELIADLTDATPTEAARSAETYKQVLSGVRGYRALLNCLVAEHFGVKGASELVKHGQLDLEHWEETQQHLSRKERQALSDAGIVAKERNFFHWDVDFPDVFFTARRPVEMRAFDGVVGNPPYDELSEFASGHELPEKLYLEETPLYAPAKGGRQNVFRYFIVRAVNLLRGNGFHAFIVPMALLTDQFTLPVRKWLLQHFRLVAVEQFPQKDDPDRRVFQEAKLSTCILVLRAVAPRDGDMVLVRTHPADMIDPQAPRFEDSQSQLILIDPVNYAIPSYDAVEWKLIKQLAGQRRVCRASELFQIFPGEIMLNAQFQPYISDRGQLLLRGANIGRYEVHRQAKQGIPAYLDLAKYRRDKGDRGKAGHHLLPRLGFQRGSAIDNFRRLIACYLPPGEFCTDTVGYIVNPSVSLYAGLAWFNSAVCEWRFGRTSTNNHVNAYEIATLPFPRFAGDDAEHAPHSSSGGQPLTARTSSSEIDGELRAGGGLARVESSVISLLDTVSSESDCWPLLAHDALGALARQLGVLGDEKEVQQARVTQELEQLTGAEDFDDWTGMTKLRDVDYFGWDGRYPAWRPDAQTPADGRWFPNGVAPPLDGAGPGDIPWDLIGRAYPSYPLPGIDAAAWEAAAWEELCDLLRKNKGKIGDARIRADLTGRGAVANPTGPLRRLRDTFLDYHRKVRANRARAAELDFLIDRIVFRLFELTPDEQRLILSRVGPGRPLPPRRRRRGPTRAPESRSRGAGASGENLLWPEP